MAKPLFIYTGKTALSKAQIAALKDAGYVPIRVSDWKDIRIENEMPLDQKERVLLESATYVIENHTYDSIRQEFGRAVARRIAKNNKL